LDVSTILAKEKKKPFQCFASEPFIKNNQLRSNRGLTTKILREKTLI